MGHRHNRKRTRSRPRHRGGVNRALYQSYGHSGPVQSTTSPSPSMFSSSPASPYLQPPPTMVPSLPATVTYAARPANHWHQQYSAWQQRVQLEQYKMQAKADQQARLEAERIRLFGGEAGDEVSLCEPMLRVVMGLFNGIDYIDP